MPVCWGDPLKRDPTAVAADVANGLVSEGAANAVYGVVMSKGALDKNASDTLRKERRVARVGHFITDQARFCTAQPQAALTDTLLIARDNRGLHVVSPAGLILATGSTHWRQGAVAVTLDQPPEALRITLHEGLCVTLYYCPASGLQLGVDVHEKGQRPIDDVTVAPETLVGLQAEPVEKAS